MLSPAAAARNASSSECAAVSCVRNGQVGEGLVFQTNRWLELVVVVNEKYHGSLNVNKAAKLLKR